MMSPSYAKIGSPHREWDYRFSPERNTPLFLKLLLITIVAMGTRDAFPIPRYVLLSMIKMSSVFFAAHRRHILHGWLPTYVPCDKTLYKVIMTTYKVFTTK